MADDNGAIVFGGNEITPEMSAQAAIEVAEEKPIVEAPAPKEEPPKEVSKTEEKVEDKPVEEAPKEEGGKFKKRFDEVYRKAKDYERKNNELESRLKDIEAMRGQTPTNQALSPEERDAMIAEINANPKAAFAKYGKEMMAEAMAGIKNEVAQTMHYEQEKMGADMFVASQPEAKSDPEYNNTIMEIIDANPRLIQAVKAGIMTPTDMGHIVVAQYRSQRQGQVSAQQTAGFKAEQTAGSRISKIAVQSAGGGGNSAKRTWSIAEIEKMSPEEYNKYASEIDLAHKEGRLTN